MIRTAVITLLTIGIIGVGYWGYKEHEDKNALLIQTENTYQRSFHELSYHMDLLHDKIGTSLAMNSSERLSPQFVDIWKISSEALSNVGQLPLNLLPFHETKEYLSKIGDFTYKTAVRDLDDDPLTDEEIKTLQQLQTQAAELKDELRALQYTALENNLRWMDVELALATQNFDEENKIIDGFQTVEDKAGGFSKDNTLDGLMQTSDKKFLPISGDWKNKKQIRSFTKELFNIKDDQNVRITKSGKGADIPIFSVSYEDGKTVYMDITQKGAHPLNILVDRPIDEIKLSLNDGLLKAEEYLQTFDYKNMEAFQSQQFDHIGVYSFVLKQDDVRIYPDLITVKVALDNGEIIGLNTRDYLVNHQERKLDKPTLTSEEAKQYVNGEVNIQEEHLAIVKNNMGDEVLAYEFLGVLNDKTYRIFINAKNGAEEKIENLTDTETNFEANL